MVSTADKSVDAVLLREENTVPYLISRAGLISSSEQWCYAYLEMKKKTKSYQLYARLAPLNKHINI